MSIKLRGRNPIKIKIKRNKLDPSARYEPKAMASDKRDDTIKLVAEKEHPSERKRRK